MPFRDYEDTEEFTTYVGAPEPPREAPGLVDTFGAAFRMENDVVNAIELMTRPQYPQDLTFDLPKWLKENDLWDYRDNFVGVRGGLAEASGIAARIKGEEEDRRVVSDAGWAGTTALLAAGMISPTLALPVAGGGKGVVAFGRAMALGALAGGLQELPLQAAQETRTLEESAFSIAGSTIVGGLIGGAASALTRAQLEDLGRGLSRDMGVDTASYTIPSPVGAQINPVVRGPDPGKLAPGLGSIKSLGWMFPTVRVAESESPQGRWMMGQLSDSGLVYAKAGSVVAPMGTIENLSKTWYGRFARAAESLDENYLTFVYDGNVPSFAPNARAVARGSLGGGEKSKAAFREEVARAMRNKDEHTNPHVAATAKAFRKEVYDPMLKEGQALGVIPKELDDPLGDPSYLFRDYDRRMVEAYYDEFIDILKSNFEKQLVEDFSKKAENFKAAMEKDEELIASMKLGPEEVETQQALLKQDLMNLEEGANTAHISALEDTIAQLRASARDLRGGSVLDEATRRQMLADAREMEQAAGEPLQSLKKSRGELKRRLRNLNKAQVVLEDKLARKLEKIETAEDLSLDTLKRVINRASSFIARLEGLSDEAFEKGIESFKGEFMRIGKIYDRGEERLAKLAQENTDPTFGKVLGEEALQNQRADKLTDIVRRMDELESVDRVEARELLEDGLNEVLLRTQGIIERRAVRTARLKAQAEGMSPEAVEARITAVREGRAEKVRNAEEKLRERGADYVDVTSGVADFSRTAKEAAESVAKKIRGVQLRLPAFEVMQGERGAELARMLDIPSQAIDKFLVNDIEQLTRSYLRTMAPDIEMTRKFGSVNAEEQFDELLREESERKLRVKKDFTEKNAAKKTPLEGKALEEAIVKEQLKITDEYAGIRRDLSAVVGRIRHTWGLPSDPDGIGYRMGRIAMSLNVLRFMGGVVLSSIPDVARPVMKYGLTRTFGTGFNLMTDGFKQLKMSAREVRLAGGALDVILHSRSQGLYDIMDNLGRGTKFERGVEYATQKFGILALFDQWTAGMKQFTGAVANVKILDDIQSVVEGTGNVARATRDLASLGMDGVLAEKIWKEVINGGGEKVNGTWMPNTEVWKDLDAQRAYRSALVREVDNAIVTPGVERPLWVDKTMTGRMLAQFKGFAMSSTSKTLMAGMQRDRANFLTGSLISLSLGALSYYLWALSVGGDALEEMLNAGPDKWADEAIDRSGLGGILSVGQDIAQRIPATQPYASFSGGRSTRRGGQNFVEALLGPTFDLGVDTSKVLSEFDDPTQSTIHTTRGLAPLQNVWYLRQGFDAVEDMMKSLVPETRQ